MTLQFPALPNFTGYNAPMRTDCEILDLEVTGEIPAEIEGTWYRCGPDPRFAPKLGDDIYVNGDGVVSMFRFHRGRVEFRMRHVRTERFLAEREAGRALFGAYRNPFTDDPLVATVSGNTANTTAFFHAGRLFALKEDGLPYELDPDTLETRGTWDFKGKLTSKTVTAHPKIDPATGEWLLFGYEADGLGSRDMVFGVVDKHGNLIREDWLLIAHMFEEAGFPAGVINVLVGAGSEIGDAFVEHPVPSLVSFTGSTEVGRNVGRIATGGAHLKRVALELGGNCPLVVLKDADVELAAHAAVVGRFLHQGQICMSANRVIVERSLYADFAALVVERVRKLKVGDPMAADTVIGPLTNQAQMQSLQAKLANARNSGLEELHGGEPNGLVLPPHVFGKVPANHELALEETFGPVLPLLVADNEAHALDLANASEYGLSSAVFTRDMQRGIEFSRGIVAGMTHINDITVDDQPNAPFGGEKNSGLGRFNGHYAIDEFTRAHWITWRQNGANYPF